MYSRARGPAYKFLENYYHENDLEHDPFKVAQHQSVNVQIDSILPLSKATWQVRWTEEASGLDESPVATTHWDAALDTSIISETSDSSILENPLLYACPEDDDDVPIALFSSDRAIRFFQEQASDHYRFLYEHYENKPLRTVA